MARLQDRVGPTEPGTAATAYSAAATAGPACGLRTIQHNGSSSSANQPEK
jgi:hypothetical protein